MFSYIILHYKNINETLHCLELLKKIISKDSHIIIVDNNTLISEEKTKLENYTNDIIVLEDNLGFAKANNIGIKYARNKYNSKFYVVLNNDVFITDMNFESIVKKDYKNYNFDLLGPKIDSPSKESINPFPVLKSREDVVNEIKKINKLIKIYNNAFLYILLKAYIFCKHNIKKPIIKNNGAILSKKVPLHGCIIIFSKKYLEKYDYPFYNETFLFHEEEFLYQRIIKDNLISIYDPNLNVFHKEGSSIKQSYKSERMSLLFRQKQRLKSLDKLIKYIDNENN